MGKLYCFDKVKPSNCEKCGCHKYVAQLGGDYHYKCLWDKRYSKTGWDELYEDCAIHSLDDVLKEVVKYEKNIKNTTVTLPKFLSGQKAWFILNDTVIESNVDCVVFDDGKWFYESEGLFFGPEYCNNYDFPENRVCATKKDAKIQLVNFFK